MTFIARELKRIISLPWDIVGIERMIRKPSYYPMLERKSIGEMRRDNLRWLWRNKELNIFYNSYGLDIMGLHNPGEYISHRTFCIMRDEGNQKQKHTITGHYNYIVLLRDKYVFSAYLASTIGAQYVVPTVALISNGNVYLPETQEWTDFRVFLKHEGKFVYKILDGECADGVMLVDVSKELVLVDGKIQSEVEFQKKMNNKYIIVQHVLVQHPVLQAFKTRCVNTVRVVTVRGKSGAVNVFAAFLRLGISADSFVDNRAKGGIGIGVELDSGRLMKYGFPHDSFGVMQESHLLSGIRFEGYQLPYWQDTMELVCKAHKQFYALQSIGWDVALTGNGPILLEGNDDWEIGGPQDTYGGLKKWWNELVNR